MGARWHAIRWLWLLPLAMGLAEAAAVPTDEPTPQPASDLTSLHYLTEEYKPYNYQEQHDPPTGLSVELLHRIWQRLGITPQPIRVLPWARGYNLLSNQPDIVLFSTAQTRSRLPLFQWACPIASSPIVLIALKESHIRLQSVQQLDRYRITAIRNDVGEQLLLSQGGIPMPFITATLCSKPSSNYRYTAPIWSPAMVRSLGNCSEIWELISAVMKRSGHWGPISFAMPLVGRSIRN